MICNMHESKVNTELYALCHQGDLLSVQDLVLNCNGNINYENEWGDTLLSVTYTQCHWHVFSFILAQENLDIHKHNLWLYLFDAVAKGYIEPVQILSPLCNTKDLNDALVIACLSGDSAIVEWLLFNTPVNALYCNSQGVSPLSAAISRDHWNIVCCLTNIANVIPGEHELYLCMKQAAEEGNINKMKVFFRFSSLFLLNECLLTSCLYGHVSCVQWLLSSTSADYQYEDKEGQKPLTAACNQGHWDVVKYFVETKLLNLSQSETWAYLLSLAGKSIPEISICVLIEFSSLEQRNAALIDACDKGSLSVAELLVVKAGADVNCQKYSWGYTTLTAACHAHQLHMVNFIVNTPTFDHSKHDLYEILFDAMTHSSTGEFGYLAPFVTELQLNNLLYDASKFGETKIVRWLLLNTTVDVNSKHNIADDFDDDDDDDDLDMPYDSDTNSLRPFWWSYCYEHTPVSIACKKGHWDIVKFLIRSSTFDGNKQSCWRLLLSASLADQEEEMKIFVKFCNDDETVNDALVIASKQGNLDIVKWLLSNCDIDINYHSDTSLYYGETCLTVACKESHWDVVKYLAQQPNIDPEEHELCEYVFERVVNDNCDENDLMTAYLQAKTLRELYDSDDGGDLWESWSDPEQ